MGQRRPRVEDFATTVPNPAEDGQVVLNARLFQRQPDVQFPGRNHQVRDLVTIDVIQVSADPTPSGFAHKGRFLQVPLL